jgi:cytochrome c peroxidase
MLTISQALASYERTLVSANSPFDRWYYGDDKTALDASAVRGFELFTGKGRCSACHLIAADSALFTDQLVHNTGIGYERSMRRPTDSAQRVLIAPGIYIDADANAVSASAEAPPADLGYYEISQDPADSWKYRTPSLRNVALTAPYMHDGSLVTLEDVVAFYDGGAIDNAGLDPLLQPLRLNTTERADLVAFLESLTGDNINRIVSDAFNAPVGNVGNDADAVRAAADRDRAAKTGSPQEPGTPLHAPRPVTRLDAVER